MEEKYSVVINTIIEGKSLQKHSDPVFIYITKDFNSLQEAEAHALALRRNYPEIRVGILDHQLQQIIEIR